MSPMSPRLLRPRASGFNPKSIANLGLWLDASADSSLTFNGNTVSEWRDLSGGNRHFTQGTAAQQPNAVTNTLNGRRTLTFSSGGMESTAGRDIARNVGGLTLFAVFSKTNVNDGNLWVATRNGSNAQLRAGFVAASGAWQIAGRRLDSNSFDGASYSATGRLGPAVASNVFDYANAKAFGYYNGSLLATDDPFQDAGNTSDTDSDYVGIGSGASAVNIFAGYIAEVLIYRRALSDAERKRVERYLGSKWGITVA